jgi:hypothetical protein
LILFDRHYAIDIDAIIDIIIIDAIIIAIIDYAISHY